MREVVFKMSVPKIPTEKTEKAALGKHGVQNRTRQKHAVLHTCAYTHQIFL